MNLPPDAAAASRLANRLAIKNRQFREHFSASTLIGAMNSSKCSLWVCLALGYCLSTTKSMANSVSIHPVADTTLQASYPNQNFGDGTSFTAGDRRQGGITRALMLFDIAANVPANATIDSVSLTLHVVRTPSGGLNSTFDLHQMMDSWGEGSGSDHGGSATGINQANWNLRFAPGFFWTRPGGDFVSTVSASTSVAGNGAYTFASTPNLVRDVQGWVSEPTLNFGWILTSELESTATSIRRFGSRDAGADAPTLTINFTPVPEPSTWTLLALGGLFFCSQVFCRNRRARVARGPVSNDRTSPS